MSAAWGALAARAAGLRARQLGPDVLAAVASAETTADLARILERSRFARYLSAREPGPGEVERVVARVHAEEVATLTRWSGAGADLGPVTLVIDAHNVRSIVRGMVGGLSAQERLAGVVATPDLGRRALERLARADTPRAVAVVLKTMGHPLGPALAPEAGRATPDLFRLERALAVAVAPAGRGRGPEPVRDYVGDEIDGWNVASAVLLVTSRSESPRARLFVPGGRVVGRSDFVAASSSAGVVACLETLARATRGTVLGSALADTRPTLGGITERLLEARISATARRVAVDPLTAASTLLFFLQVEREARAMRRASWRTRFRERRVA